MKRSIKSDSSIRIAVIFLLSIVLLIIGGVLLKVFLLLRASTFDGQHQYIVEVDNSPTSGELLAFMPENKSVSILHVNGKVDRSYGVYLAVPVDATVAMESGGSVDKQIGRMFFDTKKESGITIIDKLRLLLFINGLKNQDIHEQTLTLPIDDQTSSKVLPTLFLDNALYNDNASIAIINATGESGIGNLVAKELSVIGVNVVSVTTAGDTQQTTTFTTDNTNSYTLSRVEKLFHTQSSKKSQTIADMTLTVGKDSLSQLQ